MGDKNDGSAVAGSDVATFLGLELTNYNDDTIPLSTGNFNTPSSFHESKDKSTVQIERQQSLFSIATLPMLGTRKSSWWRPEGTGILRIGASEGKAAAIPVQSIANNTALREIRKSSMEGAADMPDLKRLSIMKRTSFLSHHCCILFWCSFLLSSHARLFFTSFSSSTSFNNSDILTVMIAIILILLLLMSGTDPGTQDPTAVPSTPESAAAAADKSETDFPVVNFMTSGETFKVRDRHHDCFCQSHLPHFQL